MTVSTATIEPQLGKGIYSIPDAAAILDMPVGKVRRWVKSTGSWNFYKMWMSHILGEKAGKKHFTF